MFAKNNQISGRQAMRLITFDLLGYSALLIPSALAGVAGRDGIFSLVIGGAAGFLYLRLLKAVMGEMQESYSAYIEKTCGSFGGKVIKAGYLIYFLLLAGRVASVFAELVVSELLEKQFRLILLIIMGLVFYGVTGGIEGRARVYEILFWILLIPLFVMMLFAMPTVDGDYWMPVLSAGPAAILEGGYLVFLCISVLCLLPFLAEYVKAGETLYVCGKKALLLTGSILLVLYLILLGMFGSDALATLDYPVVTMMSRVQITGGFLKRADAFMFGIWFFTLYALLNSLVFFGGRLWMDVAARIVKYLPGEKKSISEKVQARCCMLLEVVLVFALADCFYHSDVWKSYYEKFFWYIGTPFVVLVPVLLLVVRKGMRKLTGGWLMLGCLLLGGCAPTEVEDREFPVLLTITSEEDFSKNWLNSLQEGTKKIDYNHLKVVLLERDFLEDDAAMGEMLALLKEDKNVPLNAYVVTVDNLEQIEKAGENLEVPLGNYLESLLEHSDEIKKETYPTLGMLYQEAENRMETLFIPYVSLMEEQPEVTAYEVYKRGGAERLVETDVALLSFFIGNQMEEYVLQLGVNNYVQLSNTKNKISFETNREVSGLIKKQVIVTVQCDGKILYQTYGEDETEAEEWLEKLLIEYMTAKASGMLEQKIDVTNSMKKLGSMRDWYAYYREAPDFYEEDIEIIFQTDIQWINE